MKKSTLTYETALEELRAIVAELEANAIGIDDLSAKVKRAAELVDFCQQKLRSTQEDVKALFGD